MSLARTQVELDRLRRLDPDFAVFGSESHRYQLVPPLTEAEVLRVERQVGVPLPADYRQFLTDVGAGGAGPAYGVFPLVERDGIWRWEGDGGDMVSDLTKPWPHTEPWNLDGHPLWDAVPDEDDERFDAESFEDAYDAWQEEFYRVYWEPQWTTGAICLCHHGCALRDWLVVSGSERGHMWHDATAATLGLSPCTAANGQRMTFVDWYLRWIDELLQRLRPKG